MARATRAEGVKVGICGAAWYAEWLYGGVPRRAVV